MVLDFDVVFEASFWVTVDVKTLLAADEADVMHVVLFALFRVSEL